MRSFLRGIAAYLASVVTFIWEGGKWLARTITNSHQLPVEVSAAEAEADALFDASEAEMAQHDATNARSDAEWRLQHRFPHAVAAKEWLWSQAGAWNGPEPSIAHLSATAQAWLHSLTPEQAELAREDVHLSDLEAHLTGTRTARGLPRIPTEAELVALTEAREHDRVTTLAILDELLEDEPAPALRAA